MMGKVILMMLLAVVSSSVMAAGGPYQGYTCPTESDAQACSKSCKKERGFTFDFKVNQSNGVILRTVFRDGAVSKSSSFENCKIVDADNWFCDDSSDFSFGFSRRTNSLASGVFSQISVTYNSRGEEIAKLSSYICAKKRGVFGIFD